MQLVKLRKTVQQRVEVELVADDVGLAANPCRAAALERIVALLRWGSPAGRERQRGWIWLLHFLLGGGRVRVNDRMHEPQR